MERSKPSFIEVVAKLHSGSNSRFSRWIRIYRKLPIANWICQFARNRTSKKIIEFDLRSELCNYLYKLKQPFLLLPLALLLLGMQSQPEGIVYEHRLREGPLSIHILRIDPALVDIRLAHAGTELLSLEPTSTIAKREKAYAAINGGFFRMTGVYKGSSSGFLKIDGKLLSVSQQIHGALGWKDQGKIALIDSLFPKGSLTIGDIVWTIDGINQPRSQHQAILYTWAFYPTTLTAQNGWEVAIDSSDALSKPPLSGNNAIPQNGYIYSGDADLPSPFPLSSHRGAISFLFKPYFAPQNESLWSSMTEIIGGKPVLVWQGKVVVSENPETLRPSFAERRHPRTAVGLLPDGKWLAVVVDGRHADVSIGMNMMELAQFMHSLGCRFALNLDGGGSSTLYMGGKVINITSGEDDDSPNALRGEERPVSDVIIFSPRALIDNAP